MEDVGRKEISLTQKWINGTVILKDNQTTILYSVDLYFFVIHIRKLITFPDTFQRHLLNIFRQTIVNVFVIICLLCFLRFSYTFSTIMSLIVSRFRLIPSVYYMLQYPSHRIRIQKKSDNHKQGCRMWMNEGRYISTDSNGQSTYHNTVDLQMCYQQSVY